MDTTRKKLHLWTLLSGFEDGWLLSNYTSLEEEFMLSNKFPCRSNSFYTMTVYTEACVESQFSGGYGLKVNATLQMPLGVQLLNENKTDEMYLIMRNLHKYVPKSYKVTYHLDEDVDCTEEGYHRILFVGDQLTVCCARGTKSAHTNNDLLDEHFDGGLIPVTEDWHARTTLLRVSANCAMYLGIICYNFRLFRSSFFQRVYHSKRVHCIN